MTVKLININRESGNTPDDLERIGMEFKIYSATVGSRAILTLVGAEEIALYTSRVKEIKVIDGNLIINTRNTEYEFEFVK